MKHIWEDPRINKELRVAMMSKNLRGSKKDGKKLLQQADALRNRSDWALDKKHVYRRMILSHDAPSWMQPVDVLVKQYHPAWCRPERKPHRSPNPMPYNYRVPDADSPWDIRSDGNQEGVLKKYGKFMTNRLAIAKCLRSKNDLSALGLDRIGYLFLKLGEVPQIDFIRKEFKECIKAQNVPETWKRSRTMFIYKKGDQSEPWNWRPITIASCFYHLFMAMNATFIQLKMPRQEELRI
jgi:hypothetical protein